MKRFFFPILFTTLPACVDGYKPADTGEGAYPNLVVADAVTSSIHGFDTTTGTYIGEMTSGSMSAPSAMRFGPLSLLVTESDIAGGTAAVYSVDTMDWSVSTFIDSAAYPAMTSANGIEMDTSGNILVASTDTHEVVRFAGPESDEATTGYAPGAFIDVFVSAGDGGLSNPTCIGFGLTSGSAGVDFLVCSQDGGIKRYNGSTGAYVDDYIADTVLSEPWGFGLHPVGVTAKFYVTDKANDLVKRFDPADTSVVDTWVPDDPANNGQLTGPTGLIHGIDGALFVSSSSTGYVNQYGGLDTTDPGAFLDTIDTTTALDGPMGMAVISPMVMEEDEDEFPPDDTGAAPE
jgi:hypothetical protein